MVHGSLASLAKVLRQSGPRLPRKAAVELTDAAAERVKMLLDKRHKVSLCVVATFWSNPLLLLLVFAGGFRRLRCCALL